MDKTLEQLVDEESMQNNGEKLLYAEDMIEFAKYYKVITCNCKGEPPHPNKNSKPDNSLEVHLQIWKEQQPKIVYYNE